MWQVVSGLISPVTADAVVLAMALALLGEYLHRGVHKGRRTDG
jgi:hypothetical protein